jgi:uncharacterized repeat protein (TIGR01451 family)
MFISGEISPSVEGLHITGGDAVGLGGGSPSDDAGGGVYIVSATAIISGNWVFGNSAITSPHGSGGGFYLLGSGATLQGNIVTSNTAEWGGGLYLSYSTTRLNYNTVSSNTADGAGGGLYLSFSEATLSGNLVTSNTADYGGGMYIQASNNTLDGNIISFNRAEGTAGAGGGVALRVTTDTFSGNTITSNTARYGGGLHLEDGEIMLTNTVIADNYASQHGSGVLVFDIVEDHPSLIHLIHTSLIRNTGGDGSGIRLYDSPYDHNQIFLTNTILVSHTVGITVGYGHTATLEATLWGTDTWANETDWGGVGTILGTIITGTPSHNYWGDPAFVDPDNGNYHLAPGSAAIDRGVAAGVHTDIDGEPRTGVPDLGADEATPAITVTKTANASSAKVGETVTYTYRITNTGAFSLTIVTHDDKLGPVPLGASTLPPGIGTSGTLTYTITALPATSTHSITNTVTVTGTPPVGPAVNADAQFVLTVVWHRVYLPLILRAFPPAWWP